MRRRPAAPSINVTPLVDVLLVLLIIFMIAAPTRPASLDVKVPRKPPDDALPPPQEALVVTVEAGGEIALNATPVSHAGLEAALAGVLEMRQDRSVIVKAATGLRYGDVVPVVDAVTGAGAAPVGLQVDAL